MCIIDSASKRMYKGGMKELRNNLTVLLAQKSRKERRRISVKKAADETGINPYTMYAIANDTIKEYSKDVLVKLCGYLDCEVGDLLTVEESPEGTPPGDIRNKLRRA